MMQYTVHTIQLSMKEIITPRAPSTNNPADPTSRVPSCYIFQTSDRLVLCDERCRCLIFAREVGCLAADRSASFVFTLRVKPVAPCIKPDNPHAEDPKPHKHRYAALRRAPLPLSPPSIPKLPTPIYHQSSYPWKLIRIAFAPRHTRFLRQANVIDPLSNEASFK